MKDFPDLTVTMPITKPVELAENRNAVMAAFATKQEAKLRVVVSVYGPPSSPQDKNSWGRYYGFLGTTPTLICRTPEAVDYFMRRFRELMVDLNGWESGKKAKSA